MSLLARRRSLLVPAPDGNGNGDGDELVIFKDYEDNTISPFVFVANSGSSGQIINDPTGGGHGKVVELKSDTNQAGGSTGIRTKIDVPNFWKSDPENLPHHMMARGWFYLVHNQDAPAAQNLMQIKERWRLCISPGFGTNCNNQTAHPLMTAAVQHDSGGNHWVEGWSRLADSTPTTHWNSNGSNRSSSRWWQSSTPLVQTGQWYEMTNEWKLGLNGDGVWRCWIDDTLVGEITNRTILLPLNQTGPEPVGVTWHTIGATTYVEGPIQFTHNNYMTGGGPWNPPATTIYWDDVSIHAVT